MIVVTKASGGLPVVDVGAGKAGTPVYEASNGYGVAVTKVTGAGGGMPVSWVGGAAVSYTALDPGTVSGVSLSNANLKVTVTSGSFNGARSISYQTTGKYYFEVTCGTMATAGTGQNGVGIIASTETYTNALNNLTNCSVTLANSGTVFTNGGALSGSALGSWGLGDLIAVAVDLTARKVWIRKNGGNWNNSGTANPATGTGGGTISSGSFSPFVGFNNGQAPGHNMTANFGASAFVGAVPAGFTAGWPAGVTAAQAPVPTSAAVIDNDPVTVILVAFSAELAPTPLPDPADFLITRNFVGRAPVSVEVAGFGVTLTMDANYGDPAGGTVGYTPGANPLKGTSGLPVAAFSDRSVSP